MCVRAWGNHRFPCRPGPDRTRCHDSLDRSGRRPAAAESTLDTCPRAARMHRADGLPRNSRERRRALHAVSLLIGSSPALAGRPDGRRPAASGLRVSVSRARASLVRKVESDPWPPTAVQSVTPATVKFGLSANSMAWVEDCASSRTRSTCFSSPGDPIRTVVDRLCRSDFCAVS